MSEFTYGDAVRIRDDAPVPLRRGQVASVFGVFLPSDRAGSYFDQFPPGVVYSVEYGDGEAMDAHESALERA